MIYYVDSKGCVDTRLKKKVSVGPILSKVGDYIFISVTMPTEELNKIALFEYQQLQLTRL